MRHYFIPILLFISFSVPGAPALKDTKPSCSEGNCASDVSKAFKIPGTNLLWLSEVKNGNWDAANEYMEKANRTVKLGHTGWRLPNEKELEKVAGVIRKNPQRYRPRKGCYWSESKKRRSFAYVFDFNDSEINWLPRSKSCGIWLVR